MNDAVVARTVALIRERLKSSAPTVAASREALVAEAKATEEQIENVMDFIATTRNDSKAVDNKLRGLESKSCPSRRRSRPVEPN